MDAAGDAALHAVGTESGLYRRHAGQAISGADLRTEGLGHGGQDAEVGAAGDEFGGEVEGVSLGRWCLGRQVTTLC